MVNHFCDTRGMLQEQQWKCNLASHEPRARLARDSPSTVQLYSGKEVSIFVNVPGSYYLKKCIDYFYACSDAFQKKSYSSVNALLDKRSPMQSLSLGNFFT